MIRRIEPWTQVIIVAGLIGVAVLLLRMASGGTFADWPHVYREGPRIFVVEFSAAVVTLALAAVATRRGPIIDSACAIWATLSIVLGVVLLLRDHNSAWAMLGLSGLVLACSVVRLRRWRQGPD